MVFSFIKGQFIDVIEWTDDTRDTMVWRFERYGNEIKYGAKLTVREGQAAVFVHEGQLADVFGPGLYMLETNNMPIMTSLRHWDHGFSSPFKSEVYFVSTTRFTNQKWGTQNPIICRDAEFGMVRLRAFGSYAMRVTDPGLFLKEIVGTDGEFTTAEISTQIRNVIVQEFSRTVAASKVPVLDMAANTADFSKLISGAITPAVAAYGLGLPEFYIENISLPPEVEKVLDQRTSMGIVGDMSKYMQFNTAQALGQPGSGAGDTMSAGLGAGMGMAMGAAMAQGAGPWGAPAQSGAAQAPQSPPQSAAVPPPPPPPPTETLWHIAENGQTRGPFTAADLGRMITAGSFSRASLVWTAGQDGWKPAAELGALAQLFSLTPPPPPPGV